jgi:hypothetical protein
MHVYICLSKSSDFELNEKTKNETSLGLPSSHDGMCELYPTLKDSEYRISSMLGQVGMVKTNPHFDGLYNFLQHVLPIHYYDHIGVSTSSTEFMDIKMTYTITVTR